MLAASSAILCVRMNASLLHREKQSHKWESAPHTHETVWPSFNYSATFSPTHTGDVNEIIHRLILKGFEKNKFMQSWATLGTAHEKMMMMWNMLNRNFSLNLAMKFSFAILICPILS